jgi:hypothetical protein
MKNRVKIFRILGISFLGLLISTIGLFFLMDEKLPEGVEGPEAELLAHKMVESIDAQAWDNTGVVSWGFDNRTHIWDRERHFSLVNYKSYQVILDIDNRKGLILKGGESENTEEKEEICRMAWRYWANDSFWLNPISKIFDPGTERRLVNWKGEEALLVTYTSGGNTPGDSYLWIVGDDGRPTHWKFWVSLIPIGGMTFTWEGWERMNSGVFISTKHFHPIKRIEIKNPFAERRLSQLIKNDIFSPLVDESLGVVFF